MGEAKAPGGGGSKAKGEIIAWSHLSKPISPIIPNTSRKKQSQDETAAPGPTVCLPPRPRPRRSLPGPSPKFQGERSMSLPAALCFQRLVGTQLFSSHSLPPGSQTGGCGYGLAGVCCSLPLEPDTSPRHTHTHRHPFTRNHAASASLGGQAERGRGAGWPGGLFHTHICLPLLCKLDWPGPAQGEGAHLPRASPPSPLHLPLPPIVKASFQGWSARCPRV